MPRHVLILAAGQGTRMRSHRPKVLHRLAGLPLVEHVLRAAGTLTPTRTGVVIGHQADTLQGALAAHTSLHCALQAEQLGTGHALLQAEPSLHSNTGRPSSSLGTFRSYNRRHFKIWSTRTSAHVLPSPS